MVVVCINNEPDGFYSEINITPGKSYITDDKTNIDDKYPSISGYYFLRSNSGITGLYKKTYFRTLEEVREERLNKILD